MIRTDVLEKSNDLHHCILVDVDLSPVEHLRRKLNVKVQAQKPPSWDELEYSAMEEWMKMDGEMLPPTYPSLHTYFPV